MAAHKYSGFDYHPIPGANPNLGYGVVRSKYAGVESTAPSAVFRRLFPINKPDNQGGPWPKPTCYRSEVLLPPRANVEYADAETLARAYQAQAITDIKDLVVIVTLRFPETVGASPTLTVHQAWELSRSFAYQRFVVERSGAVVLAMHVPSMASNAGAPHVHCLLFARSLDALGFGPFLRALTCDAGRGIVEAEWKAWRATQGL